MRQFNIKSFIMGAVVTTMIGGISFADEIKTQITAYLNKEIKITYNGSEYTPKEDDGTVLNPIIFKGRSYLPVKFIAEKLGGKVNWNEQSKTIELNSQNSVIKDESVPYKDTNKSVVGKLYYSDGKLSYEGDLFDGKPNGIGKLYNTDNKLSYEGSFKNGIMDGYGKLYFSNGKVMYDGYYSSGKMNGRGIMYSDDGTKIDSTFVDNKIKGDIKQYFPTGNLFLDGNLDSTTKKYTGKIYFPNGNLFLDGDFIFDGDVTTISGKGKMYYDTGVLMYNGEIKNSKFNGYGTGYDKDGSVLLTGYFLNGMPLR